MIQHTHGLGRRHTHGEAARPRQRRRAAHRHRAVFRLDLLQGFASLDREHRIGFRRARVPGPARHAVVAALGEPFDPPQRGQIDRAAQRGLAIVGHGEKPGAAPATRQVAGIAQADRLPIQRQLRLPAWRHDQPALRRQSAPGGGAARGNGQHGGLHGEAGERLANGLHRGLACAGQQGAGRQAAQHLAHRMTGRDAAKQRHGSVCIAIHEPRFGHGKCQVLVGRRKAKSALEPAPLVRGMSFQLGLPPSFP
jgi:hypothetical protein